MIPVFIYETDSNGTPLDFASSRQPRAGLVFLTPFNPPATDGLGIVSSDHVSHSFSAGSSSFNTVAYYYDVETVSDYSSTKFKIDLTTATGSGPFNLKDYRTTRFQSIASASYAHRSDTASFALNVGGSGASLPGTGSVVPWTASYALNVNNATATFPFTGSAIFSGSVRVTGSVSVSNQISADSLAIGPVNTQALITNLGAGNFKSLDVGSHFDVDNAGNTATDGTLYAGDLITANVGISASVNLGTGFYGTSSWSNNSQTASIATTALNAGTTLVTGSTYPITSSWATNAKLATSASVTDIGNPNTDYNVVFQDGTGRLYTNGGGTSVFSINPGTAAIKATSFLGNATTATTATSASYATTASFALNAGGSSGTTLFTASLYQITSSWANNAITAKTAVSATSSLTASRVEAGSVVIGADSNITGANNITASGVIFGSALAGNNLALPGGALVTTDPNGRLYGITSGSNLSYTASWAVNIATASYALTATATIPTRLTVNDLTASIGISGSLFGTASWAQNGMITSSTYPVTASYSITSSTVFPYQNITTVVTNSNKAFTCSFLANYQQEVTFVNGLGSAYSLTLSNLPSVGTGASILLGIHNTTTATGSGFTSGSAIKWGAAGPPTFLTGSSDAWISLWVDAAGSVNGRTSF